MTPTDKEIVAIEGWGSTSGAPEVIRFLAGPQRRMRNRRAVRVSFEFLRGLSPLHFAGLALRFFGLARFSEEPLIILGAPMRRRARRKRFYR